MLYAKTSINTKNLYKLNKINYYSPHIWRLMFLINSNQVYNTLSKKIYNSSSHIPLMFIGEEVFIYSGLKWLSRSLSRWSVGLKFGMLSWNRKRALFKSKQLKKK
jgi:ribosomal protein S19